MNDEVREVFQRFSDEIKQRTAATGYVFPGSLQQAIHAALYPLLYSDGYPRMLYRHVGKQMQVAANAEEEAAAQQEGYTREPWPTWEPGFPKWMRSKLLHEGGSIHPSLSRCVLLNNSAEERQFHAVTEENDWVEDNGEDGHFNPVALGDLIKEREVIIVEVLKEEFIKSATETEVNDGVDPAS
jgi:hypothetical protein